MFRGFVFGLVVCSWLVSAAPTLAQAAPTCQFILGFKTLHDLDPTDIGSCIDNQSFAANGDAQQHTTNGLMAWRKADNWTAFTNGYWTWINGPYGLAKRLNSQRFSWEANPQGLPLADQGGKAPSPPPVPATPSVIFSDQGIAFLSGAKFRNDAGNADALTYVRNTTTNPISAIVTEIISDGSNKLLGKASGAVNDLQPGETRLVDLLSQVPFAQATGGSWQVDATLPGTTLPTTMKLGAPQPDPSSPGYLLVPVQNTDSVTHSAIIGVAVTDANGGILDLAAGAVNDLGPGQSKMVECSGLISAFPAGAHFTPQVDTVL